MCCDVILLRSIFFGAFGGEKQHLSSFFRSTCASSLLFIPPSVRTYSMLYVLHSMELFYLSLTNKMRSVGPFLVYDGARITLLLTVTVTHSLIQSVRQTLLFLALLSSQP